MLSIVGFVCVIGMVFGGYLLAGGSFGIIVKALPFELMMIGGAAVGTLLIANSPHVVKGSLADLKYIVSGPKWRRDDYRDLLSLMFMIVKLLKTKGVLALEPHLEKPQESDLFGRYPRIRGDHFALDFIADTLRMMTMSMDDPYQVEDCMQRQLKKHHHELHARSGALQNIADALPALGIVAAVLGIVKTMSHIDQPVEILGRMIGGALVGTFLGVLLAYGLMGPMAARLKGIVEEDMKYYEVIRAVLVAHLHGNAPQVSVETGRKIVPTEHMPSFIELEQVLQNLDIK